MSEPRIIAEVRSQDGWDGLIEAFRLACDARRQTYEVTGELAGLPTRYVNKLLAPKPVKNIGPESFGPLLGATGIKILIVDDEAMLAELAKRFIPRKSGPSRHTSAGIRAVKKKQRRPFYGNSAWGRLMQSRRMLATTKQQRSRSAKHAVTIRWAAVKAAVAEAKQQHETKMKPMLQSSVKTQSASEMPVNG